MNARIAAEIGEEMVIDLFNNSKKMAELKGLSIIEAIDIKVKAYQRMVTNATAKVAWGIRGEKAKAMITQQYKFLN